MTSSHNSYLATFYSQFGALSAKELLQERGISAELESVPRSLSASCGLCVHFQHENGECIKGATELEAIYQKNNDVYEAIFISPTNH